MDAGLELPAVVSAVVTAFRTAADILDAIKDRKDKKRRKRDKDIEELFEIKTLVKSMLEGASQCRQRCEAGRQQFNHAFEAGDAIALSALKDVVIALQIEVIQPLVLVRAAETSGIDLTRVHESSITCRKDATRAMEDLCHRVGSSYQYQAQPSRKVSYEAWSPSKSSITSRSPSIVPSRFTSGHSVSTSTASMTEKTLPYLPVGTTLERPIDICQSSDEIDPSRSFTIVSTSDMPPPVSGSQPGGLTSNSVHHDIPVGAGQLDDRENQRMSISSLQPSIFAVEKTSRPKRSTPNRAREAWADEEQREIETPLPGYQTMDRALDVRSYTIDSYTQARRSGSATISNIETPAPLAWDRPSIQSERNAPNTAPAADAVSAHFLEKLSSDDLYSPSTPGNDNERPTQTGTQTPEPIPGATQQLPNNLIEGIPMQSDHDPPISILPGTCFVDAGSVLDPPTPAVRLPIGGPLAELAKPAKITFDHDASYDPYANATPSTHPRRPERYQAGTTSAPNLQTQEYGQDLSQSSPPPAIQKMPPEETDACVSPRINFAEHPGVFQAPEILVDNKDPQFHEKMRPMPDLSNEKFSASLTQADYQERLSSLPKGQENVWQPLARPGMHNRYHGFCRGAWQIRRAADEGLRVHVTPMARDPILHWQCTACEFRSKAPDADALPDHIMFNSKYNIRYRWIFVAKSHRSAESSCDSHEAYSYGCIFCAAQGQPSAAHEKLDHLFLHLTTKHKTAMMTPEVKAKTRCVVGALAGRKPEEWEINLPESGSRGPVAAADGFFISASKFWRRRRSGK